MQYNQSSAPLPPLNVALSMTHFPYMIQITVWALLHLFLLSVIFFLRAETLWFRKTRGIFISFFIFTDLTSLANRRLRDFRFVIHWFYTEVIHIHVETKLLRITRYKRIIEMLICFTLSVNNNNNNKLTWYLRFTCAYVHKHVWQPTQHCLLLNQ